MPRFLKHRIRWLTLAAALLVVGPYFYSRIVSPWRAVAIFRTENADHQPSDRPAGTVRIAIYNIAHGRGQAGSNWEGGDAEKRQQRLLDIASMLAREEPDIVVINECDFHSTWSHHVNQAEVIAVAMGMPYRVEQRNLDFGFIYGAWRFGNTVLSRFPIRKAELLDLPGYSWWETVAVGKKRGVLCWIELPEGDSIGVIATHLSHRGEATRVESARLIKKQAGESGAPLIVAGDLNSAPNGFPGYKTDGAGHNAVEVLLEDDWLTTVPGHPPDAQLLTFPSHRPQQVIDWIMASEDWRLEDYRVIQSTLSDHHPVIADLLLLE